MADILPHLVVGVAAAAIGAGAWHLLNRPQPESATDTGPGADFRRREGEELRRILELAGRDPAQAERARAEWEARVEQEHEGLKVLAPDRPNAAAELAARCRYLLSRTEEAWNRLPRDERERPSSPETLALRRRLERCREDLTWVSTLPGGHPS